MAIPAININPYYSGGGTGASGYPWYNAVYNTGYMSEYNIIFSFLRTTKAEYKQVPSHNYPYLYTINDMYQHQHANYTVSIEFDADISKLSELSTILCSHQYQEQMREEHPHLQEAYNEYLMLLALLDTRDNK
jgi:hypothetical protein